MSNVNHISQDDLLLFSLQFLPEREMTSAQSHLAQCTDCSRQLGWLQGDLAAYAITAPAIDVPAGARDRFLRSLTQAAGSESKVTAIDSASNGASSRASSSNGLAAVAGTETHSGKTLGTVTPFESYAEKRKPRIGALGWAGWAVAAGVAVAGGLQYQQRQAMQSSLNDTTAKLSVMNDQIAKNKVVLDTLSSAGATQASLHLTSAGAVALPEARASYLPATGSIVLTASHLNQLQADTTYELWVLPADKSAPIPAGTFQPNASGQASLVKLDLPKGVAAGGFGVTIERAGGTTTPTMPIVLVGD